MNSPNIAPNPPPIMPAMTVLPRQDSMPTCIYRTSALNHLLQSSSCARWDCRTAFTICCSCSDIPAFGFIAPGSMPGFPGNDAIARIECVEGSGGVVACGWRWELLRSSMRKTGLAGAGLGIRVGSNRVCLICNIYSTESVFSHNDRGALWRCDHIATIRKLDEKSSSYSEYFDTFIVLL
jgi:hypothetical protein